MMQLSDMHLCGVASHWNSLASVGTTESNYAVKRIVQLPDMHLSGVHCTRTKDFNFIIKYETKTIDNLKFSF